MQYLPLVGRILYSLIFIMFGLNHFMNLSAISGYAAQSGVPAPTVMTIVTGLMIVVGGLSVLMGYKAKIGSILLFIFLVLAAFMIHKFWAFEGDASQQQMIHFMKNISMAGAALLVFYFGTGPKSLDKAA